MINRRNFIKGALTTGATGVACTAYTQAHAKDTFSINKGLKELKMATTWPKNFPGLGTSANYFAEVINKMSDGKIKIKVYAAGELIPAFECFDAASQGQIDLYHGAAYYWQGKAKAFNFFAAVPFGMMPIEFSSWIHYQGGQQLWDELAADFNLKPFLAGTTGIQAGGWFREEVKDKEFFKGLKMRIPGLGGAAIKKLGGISVVIPGGEIYSALQAGTIDATEWVGPWNDLAMGFHKVAKKYYNPGFHEPGTSLEVSMNKTVYDQLSESEQKIFDIATRAAFISCYSDFYTQNSIVSKKMINDLGIEILEFPTDVQEALKEASIEVMKEIREEDQLTQTIHDSYYESLNLSKGGSSDILYKYMNMR